MKNSLYKQITCWSTFDEVFYDAKHQEVVNN